MPRAPRVESVGFHHLINRGVARGKIFLKDDDFKKFLVILEDTKSRYDFTVHSFCLMNNHYHLLIETKTENLSLIARQINSKYAQYFNREYKRVGPLWQGRFKNSFVYDENYLSILLKYIEQNPIKANMVDVIGKYKWASSFCILNDSYNDLLQDSILYDNVLFSMLHNKVSEIELKKLEELKKTKYKQNKKIMLVLKDGYTQGEIGRYLGVTSALISQIKKNFKF